MRLQPELARDRIRNHGAGAGADILRRGAGDQASALDGHFDLGAGLPQIKPVAGGDADAAAITAALRRHRFPVAPDLEIRGPIVQPLAVGIGVPALAQRDRIDVHAQRRLVDRLFQRKRHRRPAGSAEGGAGRQIADDVEIGEFFGVRRIDQAGEGGDGRIGRGAGVGIGGERKRFQFALLGWQQGNFHFRRRPIARTPKAPRAGRRQP